MPARNNESTLRAKIAEQQKQIARLELDQESLRKAYEKALFELEKMRRGLVGPKSEKMRVAEEQLSLLETLLSAFPPAANAPSTGEASLPEKDKPKNNTKPHGRPKSDDFSHLPVLVLRVEPTLTDEERANAEEIGVDVTECLEYQPT